MHKLKKLIIHATEINIRRRRRKKKTKRNRIKNKYIILKCN